MHPASLTTVRDTPHQLRQALGLRRRHLSLLPPPALRAQLGMASRPLLSGQQGRAAA